MSTQFTNRQWRLPNNENKDKQSNYSMDFDSASSDYIQIPYNVNLTPQNGNFTISAWINTGNLSGWHPIWCTQNLSSSTPVVALHTYGNKVRAVVGGSTNNPSYPGSWALFLDSTQSLTTSTWYHIAVSYNMSGNAQIYINGNADNSGPIENPQTSWSTGDRFIGEGEGYWDGQIDAVAIYNYALSSSQITTLYGSSSTGIGNPMSLSPKPVAFYQLGDKSAFNGANYLVPNIAAQEADGDIATSFSPYALEFDGTNDYISISPSVATSNQHTVSTWIKSNDLTSSAIGYLFTTETTIKGIGLDEGDGSFGAGKFYYWNGGSPTTVSTTAITVNNWHHIVFVFDSTANEIKFYLDGNLDKTTTVSIGAAGSIKTIGSYNAILHYLNGLLSNFSIWNTALTSSQVSEIYNEGVPSNLNNHSAYSNLVSWWQLGSNSSFNTNWTVLDEKGSNNGSSFNMGEDAIVDGVGSYANGVGTSGLEVIGSAPFSDANSLSINMDVLDRVEDTPS